MPLVSKDPSTKVSICISQIVSEQKFTLSYRKTWITRNNAIEQVYGNWENSYNKLPHYLLTLKKFVPTDYCGYFNHALEVLHIASLYFKN